MRSVRLASLALVATLASACGAANGQPAATTAPPGTESAEAVRNVAIAPPADVQIAEDPATTAPVEGTTDLEAAPLAEVVEVVRPDVLLRPPVDVDAGSLYAVGGDESVTSFTGASEFNVLLHLGDEATPLLVFAVDPVAFRPLTPEVTANAVGVWERLADGDIIVRHDVAARLGVILGSTVVLQGPEGSVLARVGAFASTGTPPVADVLVPWDLGRRMGAGHVNLLVLGLGEKTNHEKVGKRLVSELGGGEFTVLEPPRAQQAVLAGGNARARFEAFNYLDIGDGTIVIDTAWTRKWIVTVDLPGVGRTRCHKLMVPQLLNAMNELVDRGLIDHMKREQFAGCHVARHIDWNPTKPLSMHAWGLAIDFNTYENALGATPTMDARVVEVFERWGFAWGGRWSRPDGMHFELAALVS